MAGPPPYWVPYPKGLEISCVTPEVVNVHQQLLRDDFFLIKARLVGRSSWKSRSINGDLPKTGHQDIQYERIGVTGSKVLKLVNTNSKQKKVVKVNEVDDSLDFSRSGPNPK